MFTIEDLSLGKCAVINDGTLEQLHEVLKLAFPNDGSHVRGDYKFYSMDSGNSNEWYPVDTISLPIQSVKDFLNTELKRGDLVWVSDNVTRPDSKDLKVIFLTKIEGAKYPFIVVSPSDESNYRNGEVFVTNEYKYATKVKEVCMTVEEIEKALGITNLK